MQLEAFYWYFNRKVMPAPIYTNDSYLRHMNAHCKNNKLIATLCRLFRKNKKTKHILT